MKLFILFCAGMLSIGIFGLPFLAIIIWFDILSYPVCQECGDNSRVTNKSGSEPVCVKHGALKKCA